MRISQREMPILLWSVGWASAILAAAWLLKGSAGLSYVEGTTEVVGMSGFLFMLARRDSSSKGSGRQC